MGSQVSIYGRARRGFVTPDDQTVDGVWIGSGDVVVVDLADTLRLGDAVIAALERSRTGVPHPARNEWAEQRKRALSPLIDAENVRTWRAFVRDANVATVSSDNGVATIQAWSRDQLRPEVFKPDEQRTVKDCEITPLALGGAVVQVLSPSSERHS